mgnify:CR=1 FL=1
MRISRLLLIVLLLASSYGCSEEEPYEVEKESVSIWEGDTRHVIIETDLTEHNYKLESENQEIATATLDVMGVCIATYKSGSTMIRLIDTDNNKIVCEIYVYVIYFNSSEIINWGIPFEGHPGSPGIIIKAIDLRIPPEIEVELTRKRETIHWCYLYIQSGNQEVHNGTDSGIFKEGTYEWNITSLTLMYDNKTEKFGFKFATGMSYGYILQSDKTVEYQQRYPDAGITEVKVNYIWKDNGIIQLGGLTF